MRKQKVSAERDKKSQQRIKRYKEEPNGNFRNKKIQQVKLKKFYRWAQQQNGLHRERISELEDRTIEIIQFEQQRKKKNF